jgi:hypothetical protein
MAGPWGVFRRIGAADSAEDLSIVRHHGPSSPRKAPTMYRHHPSQRLPALHRAAAAGSVEWEELPTLPHVVLRRHVPHASYAIAHDMVREAQARLREGPSLAPVGPVWTETLPAIFDPLVPSAPLADTPVDGLAAREIAEPDVFRHFFGAGAVR